MQSGFDKKAKVYAAVTAVFILAIFAVTFFLVRREQAETERLLNFEKGGQGGIQDVTGGGGQGIAEEKKIKEEERVLESLTASLPASNASEAREGSSGEEAAPSAGILSDEDEQKMIESLSASVSTREDGNEEGGSGEGGTEKIADSKVLESLSAPSR